MVIRALIVAALFLGSLTVLAQREIPLDVRLAGGMEVQLVVDVDAAIQGEVERDARFLRYRAARLDLDLTYAFEAFGHTRAQIDR